MVYFLSKLSSKRRRTIKSVSLGMVIIGTVFLSYQILIIKVIEDYSKKSYDGVMEDPSTLVPTTLGEDSFECPKSKKIIDRSQVNDDYCDCPLDWLNSDETHTSACMDAMFYCSVNYKEVVIPSSRVNDGICDCCDGSDEWQQIKSPISIDEETQRKLGLYLSPCPNVCDDS